MLFCCLFLYFVLVFVLFLPAESRLRRGEAVIHSGGGRPKEALALHAPPSFAQSTALFDALANALRGRQGRERRERRREGEEDIHKYRTSCICAMKLVFYVLALSFVEVTRRGVTRDHCYVFPWRWMPCTKI